MEKGMNMQDNELDDLFRNKLNGLEVEPSGYVWGNIVAGLDGGKKKKPLWAYISVAASFMVIATAGLLLMKQQEVNPGNNTQRITKVQPAKKVADNITKVEQSAIAQNINKSELPVTTPVEEVSKEDSKKEKLAPAKLARTRATPLKPIAGIKVKPVMIAAVDEPEIKTEPVLPDADVKLTEQTISAEPEPFKTKPVVIAAAGLPQVQKTVADQPEKKKRRGFGGLLNAIVSKIDKRKDKVIEFEDNGDGQRLTGINLGIIKISTEEEE